MKKMKKIISVLLVAVMVLSVLAGCKDNTGSETTAPTSSGVAGTYTVNVKTAGGMAMPELDVYVYADSSLADLKQFGKTDENGAVSFELDGSSQYAITVSGAPKGYEVAESYSFTGNTANIVLKSAVVQGESLAGATLGLGDVMYDFSVNTPDGTEVTLSEVLKEKKVVLLNFFFTTCGPCANEFPYMQQAYEMYEEKAGVIALDPMPNENSDTVANFQATMGLTFPMATCQANWSQTFGITGYPTSIIIDRYGVICLIEVGGVTSLRPFTSLFEHFTAEDYQQKLFTSLSEVVTRQKPTEQMPTSEEIAAVINNGDIQVTYRADEDEYAWPFVITEKNGEKCIKSTNQQMDDSYTIMYADVYLEAGQAVGFDYLISSERGADVMYVIVNDEEGPSMSGYNEVEKWETCYPWVAEEAGTYEIALCYYKDSDASEGEDTVYVKNMRVVSVEDIDTPTYLLYNAATSKDGFEYNYENVVLNEKDGYYHVGDANGPLLLAVLMDYSEFSEEQTIWDICYEGAAKDYYEDMVDYFSYTSNSRAPGMCTVTAELAEMLKKIAEVAGFEDDENEWLKMCKYYKGYGNDGKQWEDPIKGLATFSAYEAKEGKNIPTNSFTYHGIVMPRGYLAKFVPTKSGVYRITSRSEVEVEGWIFGDGREELFTYWHNERNWEDMDNVSMLYYMEKGKNYYIDIAFWDYYGTGTINYDIEYVGASYKVLQLCAPGFFTYDSDATGDAMYDIISGGIDVVKGSDGYYYHDLGNGKQGSKLYADFVGLTSVFGSPIITVGDVLGLVDKGAFDFSKTEDDNTVLAYMAKFDGDVEKTDAYLREEWGEEYDHYAEAYKLEDVYEGIYHGSGEDYSDEIRAYAKKAITSGDAKGCVAVDERLAELLQMLMDKFTFDGVDNSWIKLCYYYNTIGK